MNLEPGDRVLVGPLGVYGTVVRLRGEDDVVVMADCAAQEVVWQRSELAKADSSGHHPAETDDEAAYYRSVSDSDGS